jgi:hypothetical protein
MIRNKDCIILVCGLSVNRPVSQQSQQQQAFQKSHGGSCRQHCYKHGPDVRWQLAGLKRGYDNLDDVEVVVGHE